jgi:guanine deaminase
MILRAPLFHTPRNPFAEARAMVAHADGALLIFDGRIAAAGDYAEVRAANSDVAVRDLRGGYLLPGFVDTHVHFPQMRVLGSIGLPLLDWLERYALPEEARMAVPAHATKAAGEFVRALVSHGTTTALAFGAHFLDATAAMFEAASAGGLRLISGMVLSDRRLREELHQSPEAAYRESKALIRQYHGNRGLGYAVTPRFALSASEAILEVCQTLLAEHPGIHFQTHLNENNREIEEVSRLFPWAADYLGVYEKFGLVNGRAVFAHNLHASTRELECLARNNAAVAHCPCSNASLGSGFFPMRRHLDAGVKFGLGTDVGAGTGFGILKEGLQAYLMQRLYDHGHPLTESHLLYLATKGGAAALNLETEIGDFTPGKSADYVWIKPPEGSVLETVAASAESLEHVLSAIFTLAGAESVGEVGVRGRVVWTGNAQ